MKRNKQKAFGILSCVPSREQYIKEETEKENPLQINCIRNKRERRPGFKSKVVALVIRAFGGGIKEVLKELEKLIDDLYEKIVAEMQKAILMDSENIIQKVLSGLVLSDLISS